jgi:hypothetical protein
MPPGTYTVRVTLDGRSLSQPVDVRPDPRLSFTQTDYEAIYEFEHKYYHEYSNVDVALNWLDAVKKNLAAAATALHKRGASQAATLAQVESAERTRDQLFNRLTANFHNDEDSIQRPAQLREDIEGLQGLSGPPLPALLAYAATVDQRYRNAMSQYGAFASSVTTLNAALHAAGVKELPAPAMIQQ